MPVSEFIPIFKVDDPHKLDIELKINGKSKQKGNTKDMIFKIPTLLEYISHFMTLNEGDMIITGTPAGVGPVNDGDLLEGSLVQNGNLVQDFSFKLEKLAMPEFKFTSKL